MCQEKSPYNPKREKKKARSRNFSLFIPFFLLILHTVLPFPAMAFPPEHVVVLDPGHGGNDTGILGVNHLSEKNLNLAVALELIRLNPSNYSLILTRESDFGPSPEERAETANHAGASLYIGLHAGSGFSQNPGLCRVFYKETVSSINENFDGAWDRGQLPHVPDSLLLAEQLANSLVQADIFPHARVRKTDSLLLAPLAMPAVLIEFGNLLSPQDALLLSEKKNQTKLAEAIHRGISSYLAQKNRAR